MEKNYQRRINIKRKITKRKIQFKNYLEKEFETSKNYKSELKWFDGAWSRFKPGIR